MFIRNETLQVEENVYFYRTSSFSSDITCFCHLVSLPYCTSMGHKLTKRWHYKLLCRIRFVHTLNMFCNPIFSAFVMAMENANADNASVKRTFPAILVKYVR